MRPLNDGAQATQHGEPVDDGADVDGGTATEGTLQPALAPTDADAEAEKNADEAGAPNTGRCCISIPTRGREGGATCMDE